MCRRGDDMHVHDCRPDPVTNDFSDNVGPKCLPNDICGLHVPPQMPFPVEHHRAWAAMLSCERWRVPGVLCRSNTTANRYPNDGSHGCSDDANVRSDDPPPDGPNECPDNIAIERTNNGGANTRPHKSAASRVRRIVRRLLLVLSVKRVCG